EPDKRYASAGEVSKELGRYLTGQPIHGRRVPTWERAVKWAKRKPAIALLTAAVILLTLGGTTGLIWLWQQTAAALANLKQKHYVIQQKEYVIQIAAAEHGFVNGNPYRAEETLEHCQPELRGWEWRFLKRWWQYRSDLLHGHTGMV